MPSVEPSCSISFGSSLLFPHTCFSFFTREESSRVRSGAAPSTNRPAHASLCSLGQTELQTEPARDTKTAVLVRSAAGNATGGVRRIANVSARGFEEFPFRVIDTFANTSLEQKRWCCGPVDFWLVTLLDSYKDRLLFCLVTMCCFWFLAPARCRGAA